MHTSFVTETYTRNQPTNGSDKMNKFLQETFERFQNEFCVNILPETKLPENFGLSQDEIDYNGQQELSEFYAEIAQDEIAHYMEGE